MKVLQVLLAVLHTTLVAWLLFWMLFGFGWTLATIEDSVPMSNVEIVLSLAFMAYVFLSVPVIWYATIKSWRTFLKIGLIVALPIYLYTVYQLFEVPIRFWLYS